MGLWLQHFETVDEVIAHLNTATDVPDISNYGAFPVICKLAIDHQCHNIVELHSPHSRLGCALACAFDDVTVTSICKEHVHTLDHDNLICIQDWSSNWVDTFADASLDLVFIHDHDLPEDELYGTLRDWLKKIKPGGILAGPHFGLECDHMSKRSYCLYEFARTENLVIDSGGPHASAFVCINTPSEPETALRPIRMLPLND